MNLIELFESSSPDLWRRTAGLDSGLYDSGGGADALSGLHDLVGVLAGEITYETRFADALARHDYSSAGYLVRRLPGAARPVAEAQLQALLQRMCDQGEQERARILDLIGQFEQRKDLQDRSRQDLQQARMVLESLRLPQVIESTVLNELTKCQNELRDWAAIIADIESETNERWIQERRWGFALMQELLPQIESQVLARPGKASAFDTVLLALPRLLVDGEHTLVEELAELLRKDAEPPAQLVDRLRTLLRIEAPVPTLGQFKITQGSSAIPLRGAFHLSPISRQILGKARPLEEPQYSEPRMFRQEIEKLAQSMFGPEPVVALYASGAATLRQHEQPDFDLAAHALGEEGSRMLLQRRYSLACDLFHDAFRLRAQIIETDWFDPIGLQRAAVGMVVATFMLHCAARLSAAPLNLWLDSPRELFEAVTQTDQTESVVALWHRLRDRGSRKQFLDFLESNAPAIPWRELLMLYQLQPRRLLTELSEARDRLEVLLDRSTIHSALDRMIADYLVALEGARLRGRLGQRELASMRGALEAFNKSSPTLSDSLAFLVRDTLMENLGQYQQTTELDRPKTPLLVSATPLTRTLYPAELEGEPCRIIFTVRVGDRSEPAVALVLEIEPNTSDLPPGTFEVKSGRLAEVGALESGESREVAFDVRIAPDILASDTQITIETKLREGARPLDRGREKHRLDLRPSRSLLAAHSPFTPGKSLSSEDLFVGREREMRLLHDHLLGNGTEKIPLIIGIRRIGKTTILKRLVGDPELKRRYRSFIYDLQDMPESKTTAEFLLDLAEHIRGEAESAGLGALQLRRADFSVDCLGAFERFIQSTAQLRGTQKVLVIFDEFEKLLANLDRWQARQAQAAVPLRPEAALLPETLAALRKAMLHAPRVAFVVCGITRVYQDFQSYDARMFGLMTPIKLQALDENSALKLITAANFYRLTENVQTLLLRMSGRQPYLLQVISQELFLHMKTSGRDVATVTDLEQVIERSILPNATYWTDYTKLINAHGELYRAIALAHRRLGPARIYAPFELIYKILAEQGSGVTREAARQSLIDECNHAERPLIQQSPSNHAHFGLTIGLLIPILTKEL